MKRILSIDGGGVRGITAIEILASVENILRKRNQDPDLLLGDYFDLIAGTSTGSIIATLLSWGMSVGQLRERFINCAEQIFIKDSILKQHKHTYTSKGISSILQEILQEEDGTLATLGSARLKSLLLIVLRNATTGSPWPISNNPKARFNDRSLPDCNLDLALWQLVRASTAAPTYFPPERIQVGKQAFEFIDGGISPFNNPSHLAYLHATQPGYQLDWETGEESLFLLSVGTGEFPSALKKRPQSDMHKIEHVRNIVASLISSTSIQQDICCRSIARLLYGAPIDREIGDMRSLNSSANASLSYTRYNKSYQEADFQEAKKHSQKPFTLDNIELMQFLEAQGHQYAKHYVKPEHIL